MGIHLEGKGEFFPFLTSHLCFPSLVLCSCIHCEVSLNETKEDSKKCRGDLVLSSALKKADIWFHWRPRFCRVEWKGSGTTFLPELGKSLVALFFSKVSSSCKFLPNFSRAESCDAPHKRPFFLLKVWGKFSDSTLSHRRARQWVFFFKLQLGKKQANKQNWKLREGRLILMPECSPMKANVLAKLYSHEIRGRLCTGKLWIKPHVWKTHCWETTTGYALETIPLRNKQMTTLQYDDVGCGEELCMSCGWSHRSLVVVENLSMPADVRLRLEGTHHPYAVFSLFGNQFKHWTF